MVSELEIPKAIQQVLDRNAHPYHMWDGIQSIPDHLTALFEDTRLSVLKEIAGKLRDYPQLDMIGCGTSLFAALLACHAFNELAGKRVFAQNAFEFLAYPYRNLQDTVLFGISHTGGTPVVVQSVDMVNQAGGLTVGLTDISTSRLASSAKELISTDFGGELSLPKTRSFMTTLFNLYLLAAFSGQDKTPAMNAALSALRTLPDRIREITPLMDESVQAILPKLPQLRRVIVIGAGPQLPIAMEGSLKITESALMDSAT